MPSSQGGEPWWKPIADKNARKQAYEMAAKLNQHPGGIQNLSLRESEEVAKRAMKKQVDLAYLEALTTPAAGSDAPPSTQGQSAPDSPEVANRVKQLRTERKREQVQANVAAAMAARAAEADFSITKNSPTSLPAPTSTSAATTEPVPPPILTEVEAAQTDKEAIPAMDEGDITPTQETFGHRARADSVRFIRERTNSRSASTTPTRATSNEAAASTTPNEPIATVTETKVDQTTGSQATSIPSPTTTHSAGPSSAAGIVTTSTLSEQIINVEDPAIEPLSPRTGPTREQKGKWVVRDPSPSDASGGSLTPTQSNIEALTERKAMYRQERMTTRRLALYKKSEAAHALKPPRTTPEAAQPPAPTMANLDQPGPSEERRDTAAQFQNITWAYASHTRADQQMLNLGIMLFEELPTMLRPPPTGAVPDPEILNRPLIVHPEFVMHNAPAVHFDATEDVINVLPFVRVRPDSRAVSVGHPDYLGPTPPRPGLQNMRLSQYQSVEMFGQEIWRHDRNLLCCHFPGCKVHLSDWDEDQFLCLGCGPKSTIRYCSKEHMLDDTAHWKECGSRDLIIKRVIDQNSAPPRFEQFCPAIVDKEAYNTCDRHLQRNHAMLCAGHYTLLNRDPIVDPKTGQETPQGPLIIQFPRTHPDYTALTARVERLLNLAFFDAFNRTIIYHLYRLLRHALQLSNQWDFVMEGDLVSQLMMEFPVAAEFENDERPLCPCEWNPATTGKHLETCPCSPKFRNLAGELMPFGIEDAVVKMEREYWVLRAWRQQHQTSYWRDRVAGKGFPGVTLPLAWPHPYLGEGCKCFLSASLSPSLYFF